MAHDTPSTYRSLYPNIFVRIAITLSLVLAALFLSRFIPGISFRWRQILVMAVAFAISGVVFYWMDRRRRS